MRWGSINTKQFEELQKRVEQLQQADMDAFCRDIAKELAARLLRMVKKRTPVGKKPKFEGENTIKVQGVGSKTVTRKLANGGSVTYQAKTKKTYTFLTKERERYNKYWSGYSGGTLRNNWQSDMNVVFRGNEYRIHVYNATEYAIYVEYGHRQQVGKYVPALGKKLKKGWVEGRFMLTKSEILLGDEAEKIIAKRLNQFLGEALNGK